MKRRFEVQADTSRKNEKGYPFTTRVGSAFENESGMIDVVVDFIPAPVLNKDGLPTYRFKLWPPKEDARRAPAAPAGRAAFDDDEPF